MKRRIMALAVSLILLFASSLLADKAGEVIGDTLYKDLGYGFTITLEKGWEVGKIKKDKDKFRVAIKKKSPVIPQKYQENPAYFTAPRLTILVDSTAVSIDSLDTLIRKQERKADIVKEAVKSFSLIQFSEHRPEFNPSMRFKVGDMQGYSVHARKYLGYSDYIRGVIYILKDPQTDLTFLIEAVAEHERFGFNEREFERMVRSIDFPDGEKPKTEKKQE